MSLLVAFFLGAILDHRFVHRIATQYPPLIESEIMMAWDQDGEPIVNIAGQTRDGQMFLYQRHLVAPGEIRVVARTFEFMTNLANKTRTN